MHWQYKAAMMQVLSTTPGGAHLHYWLQRNVTKSLPVGDEKFREMFGHAKNHIDALTRHGRKPIGEAQFYEFGAGWEFTGALSFYALGVRSQTLVDILRLARLELVNETLRKLQHADKTRLNEAKAIRLLPEDGMRGWLELLEQWYGIRYMAPCDARDTGLASESIDYITSTYTLEHIPEKDIRLILRECRRILRRDGVISSVIDYQDHYSYFDSHIGPYNFLQYPRGRWKWFNSPFHFQNRLRHKDYIRIAAEEGFEIIEDRPGTVSERNCGDIQTVNLASPFKDNYDIHELAVPKGHIVLQVG